MNTVAEDADLTMSLLEQRYKVIYDDRALAFTEAPANARADAAAVPLVVWDSAGGVQASRGGEDNRAMGFFALPNILIFQILLPLVSPFIDIMFVWGVVHYSGRPALPPGDGERGHGGQAAGVLPGVHADRFRDFAAGVFAWSRGIRRTRAMGGCCSTYGCSGSAIGSCSRLCCSGR